MQIVFFLLLSPLGLMSVSGMKWDLKKKKYAVQVGVSEVYVHVSLPTEWNQIPGDFMPIYPWKKPHLQKV